MERGLTTILAFFLILMVVVLWGKYETMRIDREKAGDVNMEERTRIKEELEWFEREKYLPIALKMIQARYDIVKDLTMAQLDKMTAEEFKLTNVALITNLGYLILEFYPNEAPNHVRNFIKLSNEEYYDNTFFHRVVPNFVIQGGKGSYDVGYTLEAEVSEREYVRGTLAMARTQDSLDTASTEFFILLEDQEKMAESYPCTIFGRVAFGMEVADKIARVPIGSKERPKVPVEVWKAVVLHPKMEE